MSLISVPVGLYILKKNSIGERIAKKAEEYLNQNIIEIKENRGWNNDEFERKMRMVGWKTGDEWCAYFVNLVLLETFAEMGLGEHVDMVSKLNGSSQHNWNILTSGGYVEKGLVRFDHVPRRGDIVFYRKTKDSNKGHVGIVAHTSKLEFTTIEGNVQDKISIVKRYTEFNKPQGNLWLLGFIRFQRG